MKEFTLVKPKIAEVIKGYNLVDENEIMILTKMMIKSNQGNMLVPIPYIITLNNQTINMISATKKGFFIESIKITQKEVDSRFEFDKENILNVSYKKVLGGRKLHIQVAPSPTRPEDGLFTGEIIIDVTKKLESGFARILELLEIKVS